LFDHLLTEASRYAEQALTSPAEIAALVSVLVAAGLVLVSSFVKTMIPLRWLAIGSNFGYVIYGAIHPSYPMLLLHAVLVPINLYRLREMVRLTRRVVAATAAAERSGVWLKPYMRAAKLRAGTVLFKQGDVGDRLYLLAEGRIDLVEIGGSIEPGVIFGEIAFFAPDRRRRLTARCGEDSIVLSIDESTVRQLYYQNPAFGFKLTELVAARLSADVERVTSQLIGLQAAVKSQGGTGPAQAA
jgi:CRP/FNR family transcriptional regulator, cyclic AMP receptor protein